MKNLAPHNQALHDCIAANQPVSAATLFAQFAGAGESMMEFSKRLHYLHSNGWLVKEGSSTRARWSINPDQVYYSSKPRKPHQKFAESAFVEAEIDVPEALPLPCPSYDVMRAPVWVPPRNASSRPGSEDFLKLRSVGNRC